MDTKTLNAAGKILALILVVFVVGFLLMGSGQRSSEAALQEQNPRELQ